MPSKEKTGRTIFDSPPEPRSPSQYFSFQSTIQPVKRRRNVSRYSAEEKLNIVLRQIKGETWEELHAELNVSISEMKRWKQVAMEAMVNRLRQPSKSHPVLTEFRMLLQKISDDVQGWKPRI